MKPTLDMSLEYDVILKYKFKLMTRVAPSFKDQLIETDDVHEEFDED